MVGLGGLEPPTSPLSGVFMVLYRNILFACLQPRYGAHSRGSFLHLQHAAQTLIRSVAQHFQAFCVDLPHLANVMTEVAIEDELGQKTAEHHLEPTSRVLQRKFGHGCLISY